MIHRYLVSVFALLVLAAMSVNTVLAKSVLKKGQHLAIAGDSITQQKNYSLMMEAYLKMCTPQLELDIAQFGWSGEKAQGFERRMKADLGWFAPDVATTCYGMNDGTYRPYNDRIGSDYKKFLNRALEKFKEMKTYVVVGTPGVVDTTFYKRGSSTPEQYNDTLQKLGNIAKELSVKHSFNFANVFDVMADVMPKAKAKYGEKFPIGGTDGVHPRTNGHFLMAYAFLKGLELDGHIGTFTVSMKGKSGSKVTEGHTITSAAGGTLGIESTRFPFVHFGKDEGTDGTESMRSFVPFDKDLNRMILKVTDLKSDKAAVTWGGQTLEFTKAQLASGINLTEYFKAEPFRKAFETVYANLRAKQVFETTMVKDLLNRFPRFEQALAGDAAAAAALGVIKERLIQKRITLVEAAAASFKPVRHTITVKGL